MRSAGEPDSAEHSPGYQTNAKANKIERLSWANGRFLGRWSRASNAVLKEFGHRATTSDVSIAKRQSRQDKPPVKPITR